MAPLTAGGFQVVLLDLGGTLIYFDGNFPEVIAESHKVMARALARAGLRLDESFLQDFNARVESYYNERSTEFIEYTALYILKTVLAEHGVSELPEPVMKQVIREMFEVSEAHWHPEADAISTLETLRERGYRMGLISNAADDDDVQALIDKAGVRGFFDIILTSAAVGVRKPNPRIYQLALRHFGIGPDQAVMVGDTLGADILGARNTGIASVWITRRAETPANHDHLDTSVPDAEIAALSELPGLLAAWPMDVGAR